MFPMPALCRKAAWATLLLIGTPIMALPGLAQTPSPASPDHAPVDKAPTPPIPSPPNPAPPNPAPPNPSPQAPVDLKAPASVAMQPVKAAPAAPPAPGPQAAQAPAPVPPAPAAPNPGPPAGTAQPGPATVQAPAKPAGKPAAAPKLAPTPGPGVNDAGEGAASLRTGKMALISLIDRSVIGKEKREIGHVIDVLVDVKGQPAALVVDVGGFMGMGNRRIAIAWERFALAGRKTRDALQLPMTDAQVKAAPAYEDADEVTVVQGAVEPPAGKPEISAAAKAALDASRVDLGEGLSDHEGEPGSGEATSADRLNPD